MDKNTSSVTLYIIALICFPAPTLNITKPRALPNEQSADLIDLAAPSSRLQPD